MQLPEPPPPPLTSLWDRILRARALPPDLDVQLLYVAIRDRLIHPEWEVRLHALRVLADLLPISGNALAFPFDQVVDNLGHSSPNVRKAALDALKVFCSFCEDPECAARAILDKCAYQNIRPHSADVDAKANVVTGLILSIPSVIGILKRRNPKLNVYPMFLTLGEKLFDSRHKDVALRSLVKLRRVCGPRDYVIYLKKLDPEVQDKFRQLCEMYDEDSNDVYYAPRKSSYLGFNHQIVRANVINGTVATPLSISTDSSSDDSFNNQFYRNNFGKIIIETEIKFDSDTAITMTVLEENETESDRKSGSEDDFESSDHNTLKYSDGDADSAEDPDVVVKKVRFGGESVKIRTPDSENQVTSEDDKTSPTQNEKEDNIKEVTTSVTPVILNKMNEIKNEALERENRTTTSKPKKSGIPLPVIQAKSRTNTQSVPLAPRKKIVKQKSKSLNELYDYFQTKNGVKPREESSFALTLIEVRSPQKIPSPVEPHREIEVFHNLQRSPVLSPRRTRTRFFEDEHYGLPTNKKAIEEPSLLSPRADYRLRTRYDWEDLGIVPHHVAEQLHNQENWISAVKAADQLHGALLDSDTVKRLEPAALSLVQHMWALSDAVSAAKAPAEGAVCAVFRSASNECARRLLPSLVSRMAREPLPAALPHALLQRLALHHLVDLIFDPYMIGVSGDLERLQAAQLRATLCLARAAGPAAVLSAVRRRLAGTTRADVFCQKLRDLLNRPINNTRASQFARSSQLPVPVRRRARSTPPPAAPLPPRRLRPLPDSAPLPGLSQTRNDHTLLPIPLNDRDSSATTASLEPETKHKLEDDVISQKSIIGEVTEVEVTDDDNEEPPPPPPRSPSIHIEDYSDKSKEPSMNGDDRQSNAGSTLHEFEDKVFGETESPFGSRKSPGTESAESPAKRAQSRASSPSPARSVKSVLSSPSKSRVSTPAPATEPYQEEPSPSDLATRDVRTALAECIVPPRHEDWEVIVNALLEIERLAADPTARAPTACWRSVVRSTAGHVRSLRSRVARTACGTIGALFEHRGRALDPELEEATNALLERCADVNKFLRADAAAALVRVACGGSSVRSAVALSRRGSTHRAGPVRAAATQALAKFVQHHGASRVLDFPSEPRTVLLRAAGDLLGDAHADTREQARLLCLALAEDMRFKPMLKESMPPTRYRAVEKYVDRLRCR